MMSIQGTYIVSRFRLFTHIFFFIIPLAFAIYDTYAYQTIPDDLIGEKITKVFLAFIILCYISLIPPFFEIVYIYRYLGRVMTDDMWKFISPTNNYPLLLLKPVNFVGGSIAIYLMTLVLPISGNNCSIYNDVKYVCISFQINAIRTLFGLAVLIVAMILLSIVLCRNRSNLLMAERLSQVLMSRRDLNQGLEQNVVSSLPIVDIPPHDNICAICLEDAQSINKDKWMELSCKHKFHPLCIKTWFNQHQECPLCRCHQMGETPKTPLGENSRLTLVGENSRLTPIGENSV